MKSKSRSARAPRTRVRPLPRSKPGGRARDGRVHDLRCRAVSYWTRTEHTAEELRALHHEANALRELRSHAGEPDFAKHLFHKVFRADVQRLLSMSDMWTTRSAPTPLDYDAVLAGAHDTGDGAGGGSVTGLRDQRLLSVSETAREFERSLGALVARGEGVITFDKDDADVMDFVAATANLRAAVFGISRQTRFAAKSMAGNIIPAIATTNGAVWRRWTHVRGKALSDTDRGAGACATRRRGDARFGTGCGGPAIVAGLMVLQAFHVLAQNLDQCRLIFLTYGGRSGRVGPWMRSRFRSRPGTGPAMVLGTHDAHARGMRTAAVASRPPSVCTRVARCFTKSAFHRRGLSAMCARRAK